MSEEAKNIANHLIGKTVALIDYSEEYERTLAIWFTDGSGIRIGAVGDDMAGTDIELVNSK